MGRESAVSYECYKLQFLLISVFESRGERRFSVLLYLVENQRMSIRRKDKKNMHSLDICINICNCFSGGTEQIMKT